MNFENISGLAPDGTGKLQNFKSWFGESVVVEDAAPIIVYHGSHSTFDEFDMSRARDGAHFFTKDLEHAASFGKPGAFLLSIRDPLIIAEDDLLAAWDKEHPNGLQDDRNLLPRDFIVDFVKIAKESGRDGLIILDMGDRDISTDMYLPFSPSQIKSADKNNGLYDRDCADFTDRKSSRVPEQEIDGRSTPLKARRFSP